ncbi:Uncharacterised protein [Vibrio cholerae]|nr:Uncharacterised protein [Vibrio cholerae]
MCRVHAMGADKSCLHATLVHGVRSVDESSLGHS